MQDPSGTMKAGGGGGGGGGGGQRTSKGDGLLQSNWPPGTLYIRGQVTSDHPSN